MKVEQATLGFAIPINAARPILQDLIKNGKVVRPYTFDSDVGASG